jgi:hypothetical protein
LREKKKIGQEKIKVQNERKRFRESRLRIKGENWERMKRLRLKKMI